MRLLQHLRDLGVLRSSTVSELPDQAELEGRLGHRFDQPSLLEEALTHRSYAHEKGLAKNFERLELLGDAVLSLVATEWLYEAFPTADEGVLSKHKSTLVSANTLAMLAIRLGVGERLRLGVGEERSGGRSKPSILADSLEAVFGAIYLDRGLEAARSVVLPLLQGVLAGEVDRPRDPKSRLQEAVQARGWPLPEYVVVNEAGPDHDKRFTVECRLRGELAGTAEGASKKGAEQGAAGDALAGLDEVAEKPPEDAG